MDEINEEIGTNLDSEYSNTLSGLIVEKVGHKLEKGSNLQLDDETQVTILEVDGIRVKKAEIVVIKPTDDLD